MGNKGAGESLADFLEQQVFANVEGETIAPEIADVQGFETFIERYRKGLAIEQAAVEHLIENNN